MKHKNLTLFLGIILLIGFVAACGGGGTGSSNGGVGPRGETEAATFTGDVGEGEALFQQSCLSCHGPDGKGLPNLGKDLTQSEFLNGKGEEEILEFVKVGRPIGDPDNSTGIDMPPKGGNPALTDPQLLDIIAYVHSLEE